MFPPKTIGIIGNQGKMAGLLRKVFNQTGCEVIGSDLKNPTGLTNERVVECADLVFFSISPIANTAGTIEKLIPYVRKDTLWLHGTSIQEPVYGSISPIFYDGRLRSAEADTGYLHLMVGPSVLSLRGQTIVYYLDKPVIESGWEEWLRSLFATKNGGLMIELTPKEHDQLTTGAQLIHMLQGFLCLSLWQRLDLDVKRIVEIGGPPAWLHAYSAIRSSGGPDMVSQILVNHPNSIELIATAETVLTELKKIISNGDADAILQLIEEGRGIIPSDFTKRVTKRVDFHIRLEGDLRGNSLRIAFPAELNKVGLLAAVLRCFDQEDLDKTSCQAQDLPGGDCVFHIGLKVDLEDERVQKSCEEVRKLGGNVEIIKRQ